MWNARLDDSQAGIKISRRTINNLRYANNTTPMAESKEEWKNLLMRVKEKSEKEGLKLNIQKTKIMASGPITSWQTEGGEMETVTDFLFLGSKITADNDSSHEIKMLAPWNESYDKPAAAAKSLQSCLTVCDPRDSSPPCSPIPGILQARTLEWVAISFSNAGKWKVKVKSLSRVQLLVTPWTVAYQAPPSMGFSRQEYWSGVPLPSPMTNLDNVLKSRDITLPTKVHIVKAKVLPVVMCGCGSWPIKKAEPWRSDALKLWSGEDSWESLELQGDQTSQS